MTARIIALVLAVLAGGCSSVPPLQNTERSAEALASAVLEALAARDTVRLHALALTEQEFRDHVWPRLPAARPERNLPFSYVWGDLRQKSVQALAGTLAQHGGRSYELIDVVFSGVTDSVDYRVHRESTLRVRDTAGVESTIRVCGSMLERGGAWKVFSYVVDD